ncbi:1257_t:CDS:1, partial [Funneliformis geosporum]
LYPGWLDKRNIAGQENYSGVRIPPDTARQEEYSDPATVVL